MLRSFGIDFFVQTKRILRIILPYIREIRCSMSEKIHSKTGLCSAFLALGKNAANTACIGEYFNAAEREIRHSKSGSNLIALAMGALRSGEGLKKCKIHNAKCEIE